MSLAENQKHTAQAFVDGYNEWTLEGLLRSRSDDCVHAMLPASINRPDRTNEDYKKSFGMLSATLKNYKCDTLKIVNDPDQHMAVVHARGNGDTPVGPYNQEYAYFLYFNEDGTKVVRVEEFLDSAFHNSFFPKVQQYMMSQQQQSPKQ